MDTDPEEPEEFIIVGPDEASLASLVLVGVTVTDLQVDMTLLDVLFIAPLPPDLVIIEARDDPSWQLWQLRRERPTSGYSIYGPPHYRRWPSRRSLNHRHRRGTFVR